MKQQALELFKIFEKVHGAASAKTIVEYLENTDAMAIEKEISTRLRQLATKDDISDVNVKLTSEIAKLRVEMTKTIFASTIVQVLAIIGSIMAIINFMSR